MHTEDIKTEVTEVWRRRGIYLLPNLFTTGGLFAGFYAMIAATQGRFSEACFAVFIAMITDSLDGRVARLTNTQSAFGVQYDSLSDMVSFGLAPAVIVFIWALHRLGKFGWLGAFLYVAGAALRLARFNTQVGHADRRYFIGLASPAAAGVVTGLIWSGHELNIMGGSIALLVWLITVIAAFLMVSNIRYLSFKDMDFKGKVPFVSILIVVLIYAAIYLDPPRVLFVGFTLYAASGPVWTFWRWRSLHAERLLKRKKNNV